MFSLFRSALFRDEQLGNLQRSGKYWKGELTLEPCGTFALILAGSREAPDPAALGLARELPHRFKLLMRDTQVGMFEHYAPYKEMIVAGEVADSLCPIIASPDAVWPHVTPAHVLVAPLAGVPQVEIAFNVEWDIDHTVAARFQNWRFVEFNGSV